MRERKQRRMVHIGFNNSIVVDKIIGVFSYDTNPVKKLVMDSKATGFLVDLTKDKKTKSVILMENDYVILSPINPSTIVDRIDMKDTTMSKNLLDES